jgi:hypothetical protein
MSWRRAAAEAASAFFSGLLVAEESTMTRVRSMNLVSRVMVGTALTVPLLAVSPSLFAWELSALYPTPMDPLMPDPERARQLRAEVPGVLDTLRYAHWKSARREWTGVPARDVDSRPDSGVSASGSSSSER